MRAKGVYWWTTKDRNDRLTEQAKKEGIKKSRLINRLVSKGLEKEKEDSEKRGRSGATDDDTDQ